MKSGGCGLRVVSVCAHHAQSPGFHLLHQNINKKINVIIKFKQRHEIPCRTVQRKYSFGYFTSAFLNA